MAIAGAKDIELGSVATPGRLRSTVRGIGIDRRPDDSADRSMRVAAAVLALLIVGVLGANVLWVLPSPNGPSQPRMPPGRSPFPLFRMGPRLHAVSVEPGANLSTRLLLTSLQGLVNRDGVELYLDEDQVKANTSAMLSFVASRYNVSHDKISPNQAVDTYASRARGLVVFDPSRPESLVIGTLFAAQMGSVLVGPAIAGSVAPRSGLPILFDYASRSDWSSLGAIGAYDRALRELYPSSTPTLLAILPPDRWAIRDYLIATKTFVFYWPQGVLASPAETAATKRILHATPRGIPISGWFNSPTLTEENSFVQMASAEGKFVAGGQEVPNLSVLTALGRNETRSQRSPAPPPLSLEKKAYVVLAVPDGDNLDFVSGRMRDLWSESARGTVPVAWSLDPLLSDLAPPMLDMYYDTATPLDRFIAGPSGAGYLYPDYADPQDLASFVAFSKRYMNASDMDVVWLLNAFTASESPYSSQSLATYVNGLRPDGRGLDYDDQPRARDACVQASEAAVRPMLRSTDLRTLRAARGGFLDGRRESGSRGRCGVPRARRSPHRVRRRGPPHLSWRPRHRGRPRVLRNSIAQFGPKIPSIDSTRSRGVRRGRRGPFHVRVARGSRTEFLDVSRHPCRHRCRSGPSTARPMDGPRLSHGGTPGRKSGGPGPDLPRDSDNGSVPPRTDRHPPRPGHLSPSASCQRARPRGRTGIWLRHRIPGGFRDRDLHRPRGPPCCLGGLHSRSPPSEPVTSGRVCLGAGFPPFPFAVRTRGVVLLLHRAPLGRPRRLAPRHHRDLARPRTDPRDPRPTDPSSSPATNRPDRRPHWIGPPQRDPVGRAWHRPDGPGPPRSRHVPLVRGDRID